jgi:hypothetical protein
VNDAFPDPSLLIVMEESVPEKSSFPTDTPCTTLPVYVPAPWNVLDGTVMRKLTAMPSICVASPLAGPSPVVHAKASLAYCAHDRAATVGVVNVPWTGSAPVKLTVTLNPVPCPLLAALPLPGVFVLPLLGVGVVTVELAPHAQRANPSVKAVPICSQLGRAFSFESAPYLSVHATVRAGTCHA